MADSEARHGTSGDGTSDLNETGHGAPEPVEGGERTSETPGAAASTPRLLRTLEVRLALLRARGLRIDDVDLAGAYARHLVCEALILSPVAEGEKALDARDSAGIRYRIVGQRAGRRGGRVVVPGLPERRFDRLVSVVFGSGFGITEAGMTRTEPFLRAATYVEESNEWVLAPGDDFWSGPDVEDLTVVLRTAAAQEGWEEALPRIESIASPRAYPAARRETGLRPPEA